MISAIVLAAAVHITTLTFTPPTYLALRDTDCSIPSDTLTDLSHVTLYGTRRWEWRDSVLATKVVVPGVPDSISFNDQGAVWSVCITATRPNGAESCKSKPRVGVNLTTDAPGPPLGVSLILEREGAGVRILCDCKSGTTLTISVLDLLGRVVATPYSGPSGTVSVLWSTSRARQGVYFVQARMVGKELYRKAVLVR